MDAGALEPEPPESDLGPQELQALFAVLQRAFRPGKGRGKGGKPSAPDAPGGLASMGGAKGAGKGGAFAGRGWKCNEVGHRSADRPLKTRSNQLQA
eukprot:10471364-Alexandrium_andersonii.AAC.1